MSCIALLIAPNALHHNVLSSCMAHSPIGHVYAELELEVSTEQAEAEDLY
jgi:hypothetical protein